MGRVGIMVVLAIGSALAGCARPAPAPVPSVLRGPPDPPLSGGPLTVHLVWAGSADLDLVVTDPAGTTHSAETDTGVVAADVGCTADHGAETGGIETATFAAPARGRYVVRVDHSASCGDAAPIDYRILLDRGARRRVVTGTATPLQRTPNAAEIVVP